MLLKIFNVEIEGTICFLDDLTLVIVRIEKLYVIYIIDQDKTKTKKKTDSRFLTINSKGFVFVWFTLFNSKRNVF